MTRLDRRLDRIERLERVLAALEGGGRGPADDPIDRALERLEATIARKAEGNPYHKGKGEGGGQFASGPGGGGGESASGKPHGKHWAKRQRRKRRKGRATRKPGHAAVTKAKAKPGQPAPKGGSSARIHSPNQKEALDRLKKGKPAEYASEKARRAAESQNKTDGVVQRYTKKNEFQLAHRLGKDAEAYPDNGPIDIGYDRKDGRPGGIEVKTITHGKDDKITIKGDALRRKQNWELDNGVGMGVVACDHRDRFEGGKNKDLYSGHELYYKRGPGAYRIGAMYKAKDMAEVRHLDSLPFDQLPKKAQGKDRYRGERHVIKPKKGEEDES